MRTHSCHCPADDPCAEGDKENDFQSGSRQLLLKISCYFSSLPWTGTWCPEAWLGSMEQEEFDGRKSLTCGSGSWSRCKGTSLEAIGRESTGRGWSASWLLGSGAGITSASRVHPSVKVSTHYTVQDADAKPADENIPVATYILLPSVGDSFATSRSTSSTGCELCIAGMCLWDCFADHVNQPSKLKEHGLKLLAYTIM